jgi:hypothetical protein
MAKIIENPRGRRMIRLSTDDILSIISIYQEKCNCKEYTHDEVRKIIDTNMFYLPEEC